MVFFHYWAASSTDDTFRLSRANKDGKSCNQITYKAATVVTCFSCGFLTFMACLRIGLTTICKWLLRGLPAGYMINTSVNLGRSRNPRHNSTQDLIIPRSKIPFALNGLKEASVLVGCSNNLDKF